MLTGPPIWHKTEEIPPAHCHQPQRLLHFRNRLCRGTNPTNQPTTTYTLQTWSWNSYGFQNAASTDFMYLHQNIPECELWSITSRYAEQWKVKHVYTEKQSYSDALNGFDTKHFAMKLHCQAAFHALVLQLTSVHMCDYWTLGWFFAFQFMSIQDKIPKRAIYVLFKSLNNPAQYLFNLVDLHFYLSLLKQSCAEVAFHHSSVKSINAFFPLLLLQ